MNRPDWYDEVIRSKDRYIIVDAPRSSGKTFVAEEWAVKQSRSTYFSPRMNKKVLYVAANHESTKQSFLHVMERHNNQVSAARSSQMNITFDWGGSIQFVSSPFKHQIRGQRFDAIVFDEPNFISVEDYMEAMVATTEASNNRRMLTVSTGYTSNASEFIKEIGDYADVKYVFGIHDQTRRTNKDYAFLLRK